MFNDNNLSLNQNKSANVSFQIDGKLFYESEKVLKNALTSMNSLIKNQNSYTNQLFTQYFEWNSNINKLFDMLEYRAENLKNYITMIENTRFKLINSNSEFAMNYYQTAANVYDSNQFLTVEQRKFDEFTENKYNEYLYNYLDEMYKNGTLPSDLYTQYIDLRLIYGFNENQTNIKTDAVIDRMINNNDNILNVVEELNKIQKFKDTIEGSYEINGVIYNVKYGKCVSITTKDGETLEIDYSLENKPTSISTYEIESHYLFDDKNIPSDNYGGNQMDFSENYEYYLKDPKMNTLFDKFYPNATTEEKHAILNRMTTDGCVYIGFANQIFKDFEGKESEFSETFGYEMYYLDATGNTNVNVEYLAAELFLQTWSNEYTAKEIAEDWEQANSQTIKDDALQTNETKIDLAAYRKQEKGMEKYLETKYDLNLDVEYKSIDLEDTNPKSLEENLISILDDNPDANIVLASLNSNLYNMDGTIYKKGVGGHSTMIVGKTDNNELIVSSWGEKYIIDIDEIEYAHMSILK